MDLMTSMMGEAIKRYRQRWGLLQQDVAAMLGVTPQFLSRIEQGRADLTDKRIKANQSDIRLVLVNARIAEYRQRIKELQNGAS
jgi:transcriptional regulator with XRE-family HTH domain